MNMMGPFHNRILVLAPTHNYLFPLRLYMASLLAVLESRTDVSVVVLDDVSDAPTRAFLSSLSHRHLEVRFLSKVGWKAHNINHFIRTELSEDNLPRVLLSIDSDISFGPDSFNHLIEAAQNIPNCGMLSMRYTQNRCNPEKHLFFPAQRCHGKNGHIYSVKRPFLCNVAGGCIALPGTLIQELGFTLYPKAEGQLRYPDDAFLYDILKKKNRVCGYLNGALATHWRSADITEY